MDLEDGPSESGGYRLRAFSQSISYVDEQQLSPIDYRYRHFDDILSLSGGSSSNLNGLPHFKSGDNDMLSHFSSDHSFSQGSSLKLIIRPKINLKTLPKYKKKQLLRLYKPQQLIQLKRLLRQSVPRSPQEGEVDAQGEISRKKLIKSDSEWSLRFTFAGYTNRQANAQGVPCST